MNEEFETGKEQRRSEEKELAKNSDDVPFPGWEQLTDESLESEPRVLMLISDSDGNPVRWLEADNTEGTHRLTWDLRLPAPNAIDLSTPEFRPALGGNTNRTFGSTGLILGSTVCFREWRIFNSDERTILQRQAGQGIVSQRYRLCRDCCLPTPGFGPVATRWHTRVKNWAVVKIYFVI